jgi:threonine dehydrogenase-like Zn-dependent dehydrogenase
MKAAIVEKPGVLTVREIPKPDVGPYDALCDLLYGATCSGTDQHLIAGRFPWPVKYPTVLGHESVGRVIQVGSQVRHFKVGDLISRVGAPPAPDGSYHVNWGGFAEFGIAKDHQAMREDGVDPAAWQPYRIHQIIPSDIDPAAATMVITWRETLSYITRLGSCSGMEVGADKRLLVVGSGGNGLAFVAHAKHQGAGPIVMIGSAARCEVAQAAGADGYFDYKADDVLAQTSKAYPQGFDFIIDAVGKAETADQVLELLKPGGTLGIYGIDDYASCHIHPHRARGTFTFYNGGYDEAETHERVVTLIQSGELDARLWLDMDHVFPLVEINKAFAAVKARAMVKALVHLH